MDPFKPIDDAFELAIAMLVCWDEEVARRRPQFARTCYVIMFKHVWDTNKARPRLSRSDLYEFLCKYLKISSKTAKSLVEDAVESGLLSLEPDSSDGRKKHVVISQHLLGRFSSFSDRYLGEASAILAPLTEIPTDTEARLMRDGE